MTDSPLIHHVVSASGVEQAAACLRGLSFIGVDTETDGKDGRTCALRTVQLASPTEAFVLDVAALGRATEPVLELLRDRGVLKVMHHAKYDAQVLSRALAVLPEPVVDTMLNEKILDGGLRREKGFFGLDAVVKRRFGVRLRKDEEMRTSFATPGPLSREQIEYAGADAIWTARLWPKQEQDLREDELIEVARLEWEVVPLIAEMEFAGLRIDRDALARFGEDVAKEEVRIRAEIASDAPGLNPLSGKQLKALLDTRFGLRLPDLTAETLERVDGSARPFVERILRLRKTVKTRGTFVAPLDRLTGADGRIRPHFNQLLRTGRFSCSEPNLQQVPKDSRLRACFRAAEGSCLVIADFSQVELRAAAAIAGDEEMLRAFREGEDLHVKTAALILGRPLSEVTEEERGLAKAVNFGLIFDLSAAGLVQQVWRQFGRLISTSEAIEFRTRFFTAYRGIYRWHRSSLERARSEGFVVTRSGRVRYLEPPIRAGIVYNTPVQGTCADGLKAALVLLRGRLDPRFDWIVHIVHDEILVETTPERAQEVKGILEECMKAGMGRFLPEVPIDVDARVATTWAKEKP